MKLTSVYLIAYLVGYDMKLNLKTTYLDSLIDDFGLWQHSDGTTILKEEGYALDDAARGLLLTLALDEKKQSEVLWSYIIHSQSENGFFGFADSDHHFISTLASDDATGQAVWAAGFALSKDFHKTQTAQIIDRVSLYIDKTDHVRGFAYALLGAVYVSPVLASHYFKRLMNFFESVDDNWPWPESALTYGNAIMPYAFLRYGLVYSDRTASELGLKILMFLEERCTYKRYRGPIGNDGWLPKSTKVAPIYSQQPIDAAYMVWAWLAAYQVSGKLADRQKALDWMGWFEGDNVAGTKMYNPKDMHAFDGIDSYGVHLHSGAESNICFLLSKYMLDNNVTI